MRKIFIVIVILSLILKQGYSQFKYNPNALIPFDPAFKMGRLDNGIRYIVRSNPIDKGKAYFYAFFKVGSIQEDPNEYGAAHFVEHLYGDYPGYEDGIKNYMESIGLKFGPDINAATSEEKTQYTIFNVPTQREATLDSVLMILKTMPFHSISPGEVEKQRKIVLAEWRLGSGTDLSKAWSHIHLSETTNTLHEIIGDTTVINHITADRLKQFHDKWYRPDNLTIIAIGDFNAPKMEERIKQIFSSLPKAEGEQPRTDFQLTENKEPIIGITQTDESENSIEISYKHNAVPYTQKRLREELTDQLISEMFSQRIREAAENQTFPLTLNWANYENFYLRLFQYNSYDINCQTSENIDKAISFVLTEKERIEKYGFTTQELIQVKKGMLQNYQIRQPGNNQLPYSEYYIKCLYYILNGRISPSFYYFCRFVQSVVPSITLQEINNRFKEYTAGIPPMVNIEVARGRSLPTTEEIKTLLTTTRTVRPYVPSAPVTSLEDKTIHPGHIVKETHNKEIGTTEWTLSNGMKVVIKPTGFNLNEIVFKGFNNHISQKEDEKYAYLNDFLGGEVYNEMGFEKYSRTKLNQFIKSNHLAVDKQLLGFNGHAEPANIDICLQLIRLKYLYQQWNETVYNNKVEPIVGEINRIPYLICADTIASYLTKKKGIHYFVPMDQIKQLHQEVFNPSGFTFIFVGNINPGAIKLPVEKYLASIVPEHPLLVNNLTKLEDHPNNMPVISGNISRVFKSPIIKQGAYIEICLNSFSLDKGSVNNFVVRLLYPYVQNILREKEHATYGINVAGYDYDTLTHLTSIFFGFETSAQTATGVTNIAKNVIKQFMTEGWDKTKFEKQKTLFIQERLRDLKSNDWWNYTLYNYYHRQISIVPTYISDIENTSRENFLKYTRELYSKGYTISVTMTPK